jgi:hypothetical protein
VRALIREYYRAVLRAWWALVLFVGAVVGTVALFINGGITLPVWVGVVASVVFLVIAQFMAFRQVRGERDSARHQAQTAVGERDAARAELAQQTQSAPTVGGMTINAETVHFHIAGPEGGGPVGGEAAEHQDAGGSQEQGG